MTPIYLISQKLVMTIAIIFNYLSDDIVIESSADDAIYHGMFTQVSIASDKSDSSDTSVVSKKDLVRYQEDTFIFEVVFWKLSMAVYFGK